MSRELAVEYGRCGESRRRHPLVEPTAVVEAATRWRVAGARAGSLACCCLAPEAHADASKEVGQAEDGGFRKGKGSDGLGRAKGQGPEFDVATALRASDETQEPPHNPVRRPRRQKMLAVLEVVGLDIPKCRLPSLQFVSLERNVLQAQRMSAGLSAKTARLCQSERSHLLAATI